MKKIAIIGAGMSGLTLAHHLKDIADVSILEKSRGVGGRMATRRYPPYAFDHGAQFITVKNPDFKNFMQPLIEQNVLLPWHAKFAEISPAGINHHHPWDEDYPHYVGAPSMNAIAKHLAHDLNISLNTSVSQIVANQGWEIMDDSQNMIAHADWVISTIPPRQAQKIFPDKFSHYSTFESIKMLGCFALMLGFDNPLNLPWDVALVRDADISWISQNHTKPLRENPYAVTVLATNCWSEEHLYDNQDDIKQHLYDEFYRLIGQDSIPAKMIELHRWLYANSSKKSTNSLIDYDQKLAACGDWCFHGRVEGAFLSAKKLLNTLMPHLT